MTYSAAGITAIMAGIMCGLMRGMRGGFLARPGEYLRE
jgi:hypothetical protein